MKFKSWICGVLTILVCSNACAAQECLDAAKEKHHRVVFENEQVRVLSLQLGRIENTDPYCYAFPFVRIATAESATSIIENDGPGVSRQWQVGQQDSVVKPQRTVVQNNMMTTHREIIIEAKRPIAYTRFCDDTGCSLIPFIAGPLAVTGGNLEPNASVALSSSDHVLLALSNLHFNVDDGSEVQLGPGEVGILESGKSVKFTNAATNTAKFMAIEF